VRTKIVSILSILSILLAVGPTGWAQEKKLTIVVVEGEGAFNDIKHRTARNPVIEVHDEDGKLVPVADVVFTLPEEGASGTFASGSKTFITKTDAFGRAATVGLKPNSIEGRYNTRVTASAAGKTGSATISQSNTLAGGALSTQTGHSHTKIILILLASGAATAGIFVATHHGGSSSSAPAPATATLSVGPVTVGAPH